MTRANLGLVVTQLAGNVLLAFLFYYWLGIGESRTASLAWSLAVVLILVCMACVLHGGTFVYAAGEPALWPAFRRALRNLLPLLAAALVVLALYLLLARWAEYSAQPAFKLASWLTLKLRKPVKPAAILRALSVLTWLVRWIALPVILLPMAAGVANQGWRGFTRIGKADRRLYWVQAPVLLLCALWLPFKLFGWVPQTTSFAVEILSFAARLLAAYLLFVVSWLLLARLTSAGKPVSSHPRTAVSP